MEVTKKSAEPLARPRKRSRLRAWSADASRSLPVPLVLGALIAMGIALNVTRYDHGPLFVLAGVSLPIAKAFAAVTDVTYGLILLPVSRNFVTLLRCARW